MDCGDGVTVNPFSNGEGERNDNCSKLTTVERPVTLFEMDGNSCADIAESQSNGGNNLDFATPTGTVRVTMLHPQSCEMLEAMQNSIHSSDSSNNSNTDICILEVNESHYGMEAKCENKDESSCPLENSESSIDAPDFTVVHVPSKVVTSTDQPKQTQEAVDLLHQENRLPKTEEQVEPKIAMLLQLEESPELGDHSLPPLEPLSFPLELQELQETSKQVNASPVSQQVQSSQLHDMKPLDQPQQHHSIHQLQHRESISGAFEESTEVLLMHSSEYNGRSISCGHAFSGTDSDVEVLMSEEVIESDWSAGATATDDLVRTPDDGPEENDLRLTSPHSFRNTNSKRELSSSALKKPQESTDQEVSVDEFSHESGSGSGSVSTNDNLSRSQLQKVISEQASHIHRLKSKIRRYRDEYQVLFEYVQALHVALEPDD